MPDAQLSPKVIVRVPNWLGDCIMSLFALRDYARKANAACIDILARPSVAPLYEMLPFVDNIHVIPGGTRLSGMHARFKFLRGIGANGYDIGILLPNSLSSATQIRTVSPKRIYGYNRDGRRLLLHRPLKKPKWEKSEHITCYYNSIFRYAFGEDDYSSPVMPDISEIELRYSESAKSKRAKLLTELGINSPYAIMATGAAYGPARQWDVDSYVKTADLICTTLDCDVILLGTKKDEPFSALVSRKAGVRVYSACAKTSIEVAALLLRHSIGYVGNDSGLTHLAALTGIPTVGLYLSTDNTRTYALGGYVGQAVADIECRPCHKRNCDIGYICRKKIHPEDVMSTLASAIGNKASFEAEGRSHKR